MTAHKKIYKLEEIKDMVYISTRMATVYGNTAEWWRDRANENKIAHRKNGRDIMLLHTSVHEFLDSGSSTIETIKTTDGKIATVKVDKEYMLYLLEESLISDMEYMRQVQKQQDEKDSYLTDRQHIIDVTEKDIALRQADIIRKEGIAKSTIADMLANTKSECEKTKENVRLAAVGYWCNWFEKHIKAKGIEVMEYIDTKIDGDNSATLNEAHNEASLQNKHIEGSPIIENNISKTSGIFDKK